MATKKTKKSSFVQARRGRSLENWLALPARQGGGRGTPLDADERLRILDSLIIALSGSYCHLPQKRAAYAVDPIQALQLLRRRAGMVNEAEFHLALTSIVQGLRDAHTQYSGPRAMRDTVAVLPFLVEQYGSESAPTVIVSKVSSSSLIRDARFEAGVVLETWNGVPIARALEVYADRETGGRPDARRARALESLTFRSLETSPPPDELWVDVGFRTKRNARAEIRIPWRVVEPPRAASGIRPGSRASHFVAVSPAGERIRQAKRLMFADARVLNAGRHKNPAAKGHGWLRTGMPDFLAAKIFSGPQGTELGYLRIWSFDVGDDEKFLGEVRRLLAKLPSNGLVIDIRANPGGLIWAAERLLQFFTPRTIEPTRFSLVATPTTRAMARETFNREELDAWTMSIEQALITGDVFSQPLPLSDPAACNNLGQLYGGPVVCVADANTYSSGDLFAAGFVDNKIGPLVCVGAATGAGGANVWTSRDLRDALKHTPYKLPPAPDGVRFTMAIRRAIRSGASTGVPIEDVGVAGIPYTMTESDLLNDNQDLMAFCADLMTDQMPTRMEVRRRKGVVRVETAGLTELEFYLNERPTEASRRIEDGVHEADIRDQGTVEVVGRRRGAIVQRRRLET
jgi:hypothetical protein